MFYRRIVDYVSYANWNYGSNSAAFNYMNSLHTCNFSLNWVVMAYMSNDSDHSL